MSSYKVLQIKLAKKLSWDFLGSFMSAFTGHGMEFVNLREYFPGDSVKKIDWKTTAKQHKTFVKNYQEERDINALFIFDISESLLFGSREKTKLETSKEVFYMLASAASSNWFKISSLIGNKFLRPAWWEKNIINTLKYLDNLILPSPTKERSWGWGIKNIKNNLIFVISDKTDSTHLNILSRYNDIVYVNVFDSLEKSGSTDSFILPVAGMLNFFSKSKQQNYKQTREASLQKFRSALKQKHIRYIALDDTDNLLLSFYKFFIKTV